jgi:hypothetical protein
MSVTVIIVDWRPAAYRHILWVMASGELQGWFNDPFGLHEKRYFSGGRPTKLVRNGKVDAYDEPPSMTFDLAAALGPEEMAAREEAAAGRDPGTRPAGRTTTASGGSGGRDAPRRPAPVRSAPWRSHTRVIAAVATAAAVAIVAVVVIGGPGKGSKSPAAAGQPALSLAAFVTQSAQHTLAERTAEISVSGSVQVSGTGQAAQSIPITGSGLLDFGAPAMTLNVVINGAGHSVLEQEILARGGLYLGMVVDGQNLAEVTGGRHWIQVPVQQSGATYVGGSDPLVSLTVLEQHGTTVQALGTKTVAGQSCSGYAVTPSKQAMAAAAAQEDAQLGISPAPAGLAPAAIGVWFNAQHLLCQLTASDTASGASVSDTMVLSFSDWGSPVHITAPAASDTISYQDFMRKVGGSDDPLCAVQHC